MPLPDELRRSVQLNCDISDARHAGDATMCVYLLRLRELYRWQHRIPFSRKLDPKAIGDWITHKEQVWESVEEFDYQPVRVDREHFDPFDQDAVNRAIGPSGLVYSAGYGRFGKPIFFLGRLIGHESLERGELFVSGAEYARELTAPPAMALGRNIFVRRESLRRAAWELIEDARWRRSPSAVSRVMEHYPFMDNPDAALETLTDHVLESVILHEVGEVVAGELLGADWDRMLSAVACTPVEVLARAVRDNLADCLSALPAMLHEDDAASLHFYFANLHPLRKQMFPALDDAYQDWVRTDDTRALKRSVRSGHAHWHAIGERIVECHRRFGDQCGAHIQAVVEAGNL